MTNQEKLFITKVEAALRKRELAMRMLQEAEEELSIARYTLKALEETDAREDA